MKENSIITKNYFINFLVKSKYIISFVFLVLCLAIVTSSRADAAVTNVLPSDPTFIVVSADNAVAGSFSSPYSYSYLYVPTTTNSVSLSVSSIGNGRLIGMSITLKSGNSCGSAVASYNNGFTGFSDNRTISTNNGHSTDTFPAFVNGADRTYKVYCVAINTSNWLPAGTYSNVTFKQSTNGGSYLGTFAGPPGNIGTGYFASNGAKWRTELDFAPPCNASGSLLSGSSNPIQLYDLDNGYSQTPNIDVYIVEYDRNGNYRGSPFLGGEATYLLTAFGARVHRTTGGNFAPYNNNFTWNVYPSSWNPDSKYVLGVSGVGQNNKIRIRLPFDQINSAITCPDPNVPRCTLTNAAIVGGSRLSWSTVNSTSASINQGIGGVTPVASGSRNVGPAGITYTMTVSGPGGTDTCSTTTSTVTIPTATCPSYPGAFNYGTFNGGYTPPNLNPIHGISVNLSLTSAAGAPSGYGSIGSVYYEIVPGNTYLDSVTDQSSGGGRVPLTSNPAAGQQITSNRVFVDYTPFISAYPYDYNQALVRYYQEYRRITWTATGSAVTETRTRVITPGRWDNSVSPRVWIPAVTEDYQFTLGYTWVRGGSVNDRTPGTGNGNIMPPCYPRQFDATPSGVSARFISSVAGDSEFENPTGATFTYRIPTRLFISNGGSLRTPTQINNDIPPFGTINYTVSWRADGYSGSTFGGSVDRTAVINNGNDASDITVNPTAASIPIQEINVSIPANIQAGDRICFSVTVTEPRGAVGINRNILSLSAPTTRTSAEVCTPYAVDQPYTRFYGADVFAGGGFEGLDDTCSATVTLPDTPDIEGPLKGTNALTFSGTGVQLAAFAIGEIRANALSRQSVRNPEQLSFANVSPPSGAFGGRFGTTSCANNYFDDVSNVPDSEWDTTTGNIDLSLTNTSALESGRHYFRGDVNIYGLIPDTVDANGIGKRLVIYVDGDVSVQVDSTGNSTGRFGFANNTNWANVDAVPSLYVISRGNIVIDDGVDELDGVLIAQQTEANPDTTGFIDTCGNNGTSLRPTASNVAAISVACRRPLRVNGAFIAQRVNLLRTDGSLRESQSVSSAPPNGEGPTSTRAAESFIYNPTLWFSNGGNLPPNKKIQIDSYISLPPSL